MKEEPFLLSAVKAYKQEIEAIEEMLSTGLVTRNGAKEMKLKTKAKYRELIADEVEGKKKEQNVSFDYQKSIYEIVEMFCEFWRDRGRKHALKMLQRFYEDDPKGHKEKVEVWKKVVERMTRGE